MICMKTGWLNLGLAFPNLPYIVHGDKKISETIAIFQYIAIAGKKRELLGADKDDDRINFFMVYGVVVDLKNELDRLLYDVPKENFIKAKAESFVVGVLKQKLGYLERFLDNKEFVLGKITIVDFVLFNLVDMIHDMDQERLVPYPKLVELYGRFLEIPEIKTYRESSRFINTWHPPHISNWTNALN
jgi:glutathione S-transferase